MMMVLSYVEAVVDVSVDVSVDGSVYESVYESVGELKSSSLENRTSTRSRSLCEQALAST
jgi:hypothetical protein